MPKISKESLEAQDFGALEVHEGEVADYTVNFLSFRETQDMTPMHGPARWALPVSALGVCAQRQADVAFCRPRGGVRGGRCVLRRAGSRSDLRSGH